MAPADGTEADQLLKDANLALSRAKEEERGRYRFFEKEMDARMRRATSSSATCAARSPTASSNSTFSRCST